LVSCPSLNNNQGIITILRQDDMHKIGIFQPSLGELMGNVMRSITSVNYHIIFYNSINYETSIGYLNIVEIFVNPRYSKDVKIYSQYQILTNNSVNEFSKYFDLDPQTNDLFLSSEGSVNLAEDQVLQKLVT
jgi:hypothetical protein